VAAWLWLPGLGRRAALITTIVVTAQGGLALSIAAALEGRPWLDYRQWELAAPSDPRSFIWDHSFGPLAPRDGTPLLGVRIAEPHYWRTAVLDEFDGYVWRLSRRDVGQPELELPTAVDGAGEAREPTPLNPDWLVRAELTLQELRSALAIAPGALISTDGIEVDPTPNGTALVEGAPLGEGDHYTVLSYAPSPSAAEMRLAPDAYAPPLAATPRSSFPGSPTAGQRPTTSGRSSYRCARARAAAGSESLGGSPAPPTATSSSSLGGRRLGQPRPMTR
jgi:hypothetical protein